MTTISAAHDMDYGLNFSLSNFFSMQAKRKQLQQQHQYHPSACDWRSAPSPALLSCKPFSSAPQHFSEFRKPGDRFVDDSNKFSNSFQDEKAPNFGPYRSNTVSKKDYSNVAQLSISSVAYSDITLSRRLEKNHSDKYSAQSPHCRSALKPPEKFPQTNLSFSGVPVEDNKNDKTPTILAKLVNQLLDDSGTDIKVTQSSIQPKTSGNWDLENESIGEMAIKLADIALMDESVAKPVALNNVQQVEKGPNFPAQVNVMTQIKDTSKTKPITEDTNPRGNNNRKESTHYTPSVKNRMKENFMSFNEKTALYPHECAVNTFGKKKKESPKNAPWCGRRLKPESTYFKVKAEPALSRNAGGKAIYNSDSHKKTKSPSTFKVLAGVSSWMELQAMDSKSDSSWSSNEFLCGFKESSVRHSSAGAFKYNSFYKPKNRGDDLFQEMQHDQHPRKSFSSSSTSSSSGGRYKRSECVFCKTNGETAEMYRSHVLKDEQGRIICQVLQQYVCPLCGATGTNAHTVKYCPENKNPPAVATMTTLKSMRSSTGRKRYGPCSGHIHQAQFCSNHYLLPA